VIERSIVFTLRDIIRRLSGVTRRSEREEPVVASGDSTIRYMESMKMLADDVAGRWGREYDSAIEAVKRAQGGGGKGGGASGAATAAALDMADLGVRAMGNVAWFWTRLGTAMQGAAEAGGKEEKTITRPDLSGGNPGEAGAAWGGSQ